MVPARLRGGWAARPPGPGKGLPSGANPLPRLSWQLLVSDHTRRAAGRAVWDLPLPLPTADVALVSSLNRSVPPSLHLSWGWGWGPWDTLRASDSHQG